MFETQKFGIDLAGGKLHIVDLQDKSCRIEVDQIVFEASSVSSTWATGLIVSVHGLPQEVAGILPAALIRQLGVGSQYRPTRGVRGTKRFRAVAGEATFQRVTDA